jgi:LSD1 subclass zinc finger protein
MNDRIVIPCEQCRRLVGVPTDRGSIKVQCPHCQATFILTPDLLINQNPTPEELVLNKMKCLSCGYVRHPDDDELSFAKSTQCPMCLRLYELGDKEFLEDGQLRKKLDREYELERINEKRELAEQQTKDREALRQETIQKNKLQQQQPAIENIGWFPWDLCGGCRVTGIPTATKARG